MVSGGGNARVFDGESGVVGMLWMVWVIPAVDFVEAFQASLNGVTKLCVFVDVDSPCPIFLILPNEKGPEGPMNGLFGVAER